MPDNNKKGIDLFKIVKDIENRGNIKDATGISDNMRRESNVYFQDELHEYDFLNQGSFTQTSLGLDDDEFEKRIDKGISLSPYFTKNEITKIKADSQSVLEQTGNALMRIGLGEMFYGVIGGIFNIADGLVNSITGSYTYQDPIAKFFNEQKERIDKKYEIYRKNPDDQFNISDFGWWADNAVSIATSLSLMLPAAGWAKGVSMLGKIPMIDKVGKAAIKEIAKGYVKTIGNKVTSSANKISRLRSMEGQINKADRALRNFLGYTGTAALSRAGENQIEANSVYNIVKEDALENIQGMIEADKANGTNEFEKFLENNPELKGLSVEEIANEIANNAADKTFYGDWAMLLSDIIQFRAVGGLASNAMKRISTPRQRISAENIKRTLGGAKPEELIKNNFWNRRKESFKHVFKHPASILTNLQLSEAIEEMWQGAYTEKGFEVAQRYFDPTVTPRSFNSYIRDLEIWEQGFWGALGGIAFGAGAKQINNLKDYIHEVKNKKKMSAEDFEMWKKSRDNVRQLDSDKIISDVNKLVDSIKSIEDGNNPYKFQINDVTGETKLDANGKPIMEELTEEEKDELIDRVINEFVDNRVMSSIDNGTYYLIKDILESKQLDKYLHDKGVRTTTSEKFITDNIIDRIDYVGGLYQHYLDEVEYNNSENNNPFVTRLTASQLTREKMNIDTTQTKLDNVRKVINTTKTKEANAANVESNDVQTVIDNYHNDILINNIARHIIKLDERIRKLDDLVKDKKISREAAILYKQDYEREKNNLENIIEDTTLKTKLDELVKNTADINLLKTLNITTDKTNNISLSEELKDLIKTEANLQITLAQLNSSFNANSEGFKSRYNEINQAHSTFVKNKIQDYFNILANYINKARDKNLAYKRLINYDKTDPHEFITDKKVREALEVIRYGYINQTGDLGTNSTNYINNKMQFEKLLKDITDKSKTNEAILNKGKQSKDSVTTPIPTPTPQPDLTQVKLDKASDTPTDSSTGNGELTPPVDVNESNDDTPAPVEVENLNKDIPAPEKLSTDDDDVNNDLGSDPTVNDEDLEIAPIDTSTIQQLITTAIHVEIAKLFATSSEEYTNKLIPSNKEFDKLINTLKDKVKEVYAENNVDIPTDDLIEEEVINNYLLTISKFSNTDARYLRYSNLLLGNNLNSLIKTLSDKDREDIFTILNKFLVEYAESKNLIKHDEKYIIRLDELFRDIVKDTIGKKTITTDELINLYNSISLAVHEVSIRNKFLKDIKFTGLNKFNQLSSAQYIRLISQSRELAQKQMADQLHIDLTDIYEIQDPDVRNAVASALVNGNQIIAEINYLDDGITANTVSFYVYYNDKNGNTTRSKIGALRCVSKNSTNDKITTNNHKTGFSYNIDILPNNSFRLDTDEFFNSLFNGQQNELLNKLVNYQLSRAKVFADVNATSYQNYDERTRDLYNKLDAILTAEDISFILNNNAIKKLLENNIFKFTNKENQSLTDKEKCEQLLNAINTILFYSKDSLTRKTLEEEIDLADNITTNIDTIKASYNEWRDKIFDNYNKTYEIQKAIEESPDRQVKLTISVDINELPNIVGKEDYQNIGDGGLSLNTEDNPIVGVSSDIMSLIDENNSHFGYVSGNMQSKLGKNQIGFFIGSNDFKETNIDPAIAYLLVPNNLFEVQSKDDTSKRLANAFKIELTNTINSFLQEDNGISYDELVDRLKSLIHYRDGIFSSRNLRLITTKEANSITLLIGNDVSNRNNTKENNIAITFHKLDSIGEFSSKTISISPLGYDENNTITASLKTISSKNPQIYPNELKDSTTGLVNPKLLPNYIANIIASNVNNLIINNSIEVLRKDSVGSNYLVHKLSGQTKIIEMNLGNSTFTFNGGIGALLIDTNSYKTNVKRINEQNSPMVFTQIKLENGASIGNIYRETGEEKQSIDKSNIVKNLTNDVRNTGTKITRNKLTYFAKEIDTIDLLNLFNTDPIIIDILTKQQELGILNPKTTIEVRGKTAKNLQSETARYEINENKIVITQTGLNDIVNDRTDTALVRNLLHENIHRKLNELKKIQIGKLSRHEIIISELEDIYNSFKEFVSKDNSDLGRTIQKEIIDVLESNYSNNKTVKLEEFLTESLTQKTLTKYINNITYNRKDNTFEYETEKKSIFQKIIDIILKIFGIDKVNANTILAEEYKILGDILEQQNTTSINSDVIVDTDSSTSPVEETSGLKTPPADKKHRTFKRFDNVEIINGSESSLTTTLQDNPTEIKIEYSENNRLDNPYGITFVDRMNTMANKFDKEYREGINFAIENNDFNYTCK